MLARYCRQCTARVQAVCRHAFGKYWGAKSGNGEGCQYPLDGVADAWYATGWMPSPEITKAISLPLDVQPPKMPVRPVRPVRRKEQSLFGQNERNKQ